MTKKQTPGEKLVASILADLKEQGMEPDSRESELLARACAAADKIAEVLRLNLLNSKRI